MSNTLSIDDGIMRCEYASAAKYGASFIDQMNCLYLLSYLVTADRQIAERCLTSALDEYVEGRSEFLKWADREGRRAVLRDAIRIIRPAPRQAYWLTYQEVALSAMPRAHHPFAAITSLGAFERFVFVMCTIENLSEEDSAALLNCSVQDVAIGRELARRIVDVGEVDVSGDIDLLVVPTLLGGQVCGVC
jgi:hypothetical protein